MTKPMRTGDVSFWYADLGGLPAQRAPLAGDMTVDVCIVGAGYTGLWTAYYLKQHEPALRIAIVEAEIAGFGASGRNGGQLIPGWRKSAVELVKLYGAERARLLITAYNAAQPLDSDEPVEVAGVLLC